MAEKSLLRFLQVFGERGLGGSDRMWKIDVGLEEIAVLRFEWCHGEVA